MLYRRPSSLCAGQWKKKKNMSWAANFDDFLTMPMTNNANWNMQTTGVQNAFRSADPANTIAETMSIGDLYSGMPVVVCLFQFDLIACFIENHWI